MQFEDKTETYMDQIRSLERKLEHKDDLGLGRSDRLHDKATRLQT